MRCAARCFAVVAALVFVSAPAWAQEEEKPVNVNVGGGFVFVLDGDARSRIGDGFTVQAGLTVNLNPRLGVQVEYAYDALRQKEVQLPVSLTRSGSTTTSTFSADATMRQLNFNAVLRPTGGSGAKTSPYVLAGVGRYSRSVEVDTPAVGYVAGFCDVWWYVCYPSGPVPVESVVGSRSTSDWGMNVGGGVNFKFRERAALYLEARYQYIWGPDLTDSTGKSYGKAKGRFLPITLGIRF